MTSLSANALRASLKSSASFGWGIGVLLALPLFASPTLANPSSATVTTGSASIANTSTRTQIDQKSEDVVIDWSSFNIGTGQTTQFVQPNAQAIAVNRIGGNSASQILGTLDANGRIVLINGNGMLFGKGAAVNVGSLIATSTGGSDSDVLSGKFTQAGNQNAAIVNQGSIATRQGGLVALVAPSVTNAGTVNAKFGTVAIGAANKFTVDFMGDGLVSFAAQGDVNGKASAINMGSLAGANVSLTAHAAEGVATGVVEMSGIVTAQTARNVGGTILLDAGNGSLSMTGTLNAAGQTGGGAIETSGNQVSISGAVTAGRNGQWKVDPENLTINASAATSIDNALNSGTSVTEQTTSGAASGFGTQSAGLGDIIVASPLSWNTSATLTLESYHSIDINAPITIAGGGGLVFVTNNGGTGGDYIFANGANVSYSGGPGLGASFTLNGTPYTLLYSMSDLQSINASSAALAGDYALVNSLDASSVTGWSPIGTNGAGYVLNAGNGFTGTFAGLGNTISNLTINLAGESYAGLFGYAGTSGGSAVIRDLGLVGGSVNGMDYVGGLIGENYSGALSDDYFTGTVSGAETAKIKAPYYVGGLVGYNGGDIADSYASATVSDLDNASSHGMDVGGLAGFNGATISNSYATGATSAASGSKASGQSIGGLVGVNDGYVTSDNATGAVSTAAKSQIGQTDIGGLVGQNLGDVAGSYATGAVSGGGDTGGLVGLALNTTLGAISNSYATGAVTGSHYSGGLVGENSGPISNSYATGTVSAGGGLVGFNAGTIGNSYATGMIVDGGAGLVDTNDGAITDSFSIGAVLDGKGLVATVDTYGTATDSYWDTQTSGQTESAEGMGLTTAQLLSALPTGFSSSVWGTGPKLLPYFLWQYPSGTPQVISGLAFKDGGETVLAPSSKNAVATDVFALLDGENLGSVGTGANGFYYFLLAPGTISASGSAVLVYTVANSTTGESNGAVVQSATGSLPGVDVWGNQLIAPTNDTTYTLASETPLQTQDAALISQAVGSNTAAQSLVAGLSYYGYIATGSSFTIDEPLNLSNGLFVETTAADANITLADAIALSNKQKLRLDATGNVAIDGTVSTGGSVSLTAGGTITFADAVTGSTGVNLNSGGNIDIDKKIVATGGTVTLSSGGTITESGAGYIDAAMLAGNSAGGTTLNGSNVIGTLEAFTNSGAGGIALKDTGGALTVDGALNSGTGALSLTTTAGGLTIDQGITSGGAMMLTSADPMTVSAPISAAGALTLNSAGAITIGQSIASGGTATLISGGTVTESSGGLIDANTLAGSSDGTATLKGANQIANIAFSPTGGGDLLLADDSNLTITGLIQAGKVTLADTGTIDETTGAIDATSLTGSSAGGATLNADNLIGAMGAFANTGAGGFALMDGEALTVGGAINAGTGNLSITTTGSASNIKINQALTAGGTVSLNSSGTLSQSSTDVITAGELTGSSTGATTLNGANQIASLGNFTNTGGNLALTDEQNLTISGTVRTGTHNQTIQVTSGNLDLTGALDAGTVTLGSSTGEVYGAGVITAAVLNVTANTGIDLTGDNDIGTIGTDQTNSGPNVINNPG